MADPRRFKFKCPICEYREKRFVDRYYWNRHLLTHYKGTMICGFCPETASAPAKCFTRVHVFKRHLYSAHRGMGWPKLQDQQQAMHEMQRENSTMDSKDSKPTDPAIASAILRTSGINPKSLTASQFLLFRQNPAMEPESLWKRDTFRARCSTCASTFVNAQKLYEHVDGCVIRAILVDQDGCDGSEILSGDNVWERRVAKVLKVETVAEVILENTEAENEPIQSVIASLTAVEQLPTLFVARTISQDLTRGEEANTRSLLCALQDRPSGLRTASGGLRISSKRLFAEKPGDGIGKISKRMFAEEGGVGLGKISKRLFAEEGGSGAEKRRKFRFR